MRRRSSSTLALAAAVAAAAAACTHAQHHAPPLNMAPQGDTYLRRRLQQAQPGELFPEGPGVVCWDYSIAGEQGADLTADQVNERARKWGGRLVLAHTHPSNFIPIMIMQLFESPHAYLPLPPHPTLPLHMYV